MAMVQVAPFLRLVITKAAGSILHISVFCVMLSHVTYRNYESVLSHLWAR